MVAGALSGSRFRGVAVEVAFLRRARELCSLSFQHQFRRIEGDREGDRGAEEVSVGKEEAQDTDLARSLISSAAVFMERRSFCFVKSSSFFDRDFS